MSSVDIKSVGVLGAGLMGSEVALDLACHGYKVLLKDISKDRLRAAKAKIEGDYKLLKMLRRDHLIPAIDEILEQIVFTDTATIIFMKPMC
jgi:3-hydroxybutyryl-CoA dehydrogenase